MTGQVSGNMTFDVTNLEVREPLTAVAPSNIIAVTEDFNVGATFVGTGQEWTNIQNLAIAYTVSYFAEGIGTSALEIDLGDYTGNLTPLQNTYSPPETELLVPANTLTPGVYRIACVVTFPTWPGLIGFFENLVVQVYQP